MSLHHIASHLASKGRNGDTMLVHMTPEEVGGLQNLALSAYGRPLSVNPETGVVEANILKSLLPSIVGAIGGGLGLSQGMSSLLGAVAGGVANGWNLRGIGSGLLGGYGGYGIGKGLRVAGQPKVGPTVQAPAYGPSSGPVATVGGKPALDEYGDYISPRYAAEQQAAQAAQATQRATEQVAQAAAKPVTPEPSTMDKLKQMGAGLKNVIDDKTIRDAFLKQAGLSSLLASYGSMAMAPEEKMKMAQGRRPRFYLAKMDQGVYDPSYQQGAGGSYYLPGTRRMRGYYTYDPSETFNESAYQAAQMLEPIAAAAGGLMRLASGGDPADPRIAPPLKEGDVPMVAQAAAPAPPPRNVYVSPYSGTTYKSPYADDLSAYIQKVNASFRPRPRTGTGTGTGTGPGPGTGPGTGTDPIITDPVNDNPIVNPVQPVRPIPGTEDSSLLQTEPEPKKEPVQDTRDDYIRDYLDRTLPTFPINLPATDPVSERREPRDVVEVYDPTTNERTDLDYISPYGDLGLRGVIDRTLPVFPVARPDKRDVVEVYDPETMQRTDEEEPKKEEPKKEEPGIVQQAFDFTRDLVSIPDDFKSSLVERGIRAAFNLFQDEPKEKRDVIEVSNPETNERTDLDPNERTDLDPNGPITKNEARLLGIARFFTAPGRQLLRLPTALGEFFGGKPPPAIENRFLPGRVIPSENIQKTPEEKAREQASLARQEPQTQPASQGGGGGGQPFNYGYDTSLYEALDKAFPRYTIAPMKRDEVYAEEVDEDDEESLNSIFGYMDSGLAYGGYLGRRYAGGGGIASLGGYSDGGRLLRGPGDGVSDDIPAGIYRDDGSRQEARLADGEFVFPARIVSEIGNGSTEAGAKKLYAIMDKIQRDRGRTLKDVAKDTNAERHFASMMA